MTLQGLIFLSLPGYRDQPPAASQATTSSRQEQAESQQPLSQAASTDAADAKIKGWDDLFVAYSTKKDVDRARHIIQDILIPRADSSVQVFDEIFAAAVEKKEVKQDIVQVITLVSDGKICPIGAFSLCNGNGGGFGSDSSSLT